MQMHLSARNTLKGKVLKVNEGTVNTEVIVELSGGDTVVSVISKESVKNFGLAPGKECYAIIKAWWPLMDG